MDDGLARVLARRREELALEKVAAENDDAAEKPGLRVRISDVLHRPAPVRRTT
jgi:hypothetical protein